MGRAPVRGRPLSGQPRSAKADLAAAVAGRRPVDQREASSLAVAVAEIRRLADPFDRSADPTHLTGSGVVTGPAGVLLLRHRRLGIWVQPGGHLEPGETPWAAARRESQEETGLTLELADPGTGGAGRAPQLAHVDVHPAADGHRHLDLRYRLEVLGDPTPRPPAGESQEVRWFAWDEAIAVADPGLVGLLSWLRARRCDP
jgi:8-oxo-dGTP pyrophosphatase MutT (NUDIX family)